MRLLEIRIKNIASLKGEHEISFREIMDQSPLFAITGETGSGKSTILNSIGLALYGKIFKSSIQQNDVVTLGEKEGQIELLFQAKERTYLAFWRARVRKQNGEFYSTPQSPTRDLYEVQGEGLDSPKQISDKKVEDILNLDFDQFCKCVILNQGEFAKFLTSSFSDRKEILEKLYPGDILEGLSGELRRELEDARKSRDSLEVEMSTLKGVNLSGENLETEKTSTQTDLKLNESCYTLLEKLDSSYKTLHYYFEENLKNQQKLIGLQDDIKGLTKIQNENLLALRASQETHETALKHKEKEEPRLQELLKLEEKLQSSKDNEKDLVLKLSRKEKDLDSGEERLKTSLQSLQRIQEKVHSAKNRITAPVELLKLHQDDLELLIAKELERRHLSEAKALADLRLRDLEESGKEKSAELQGLLLKKKELPQNLEAEILNLTQKKDLISKETDKKNKSLIQAQELEEHLTQLQKDLQILGHQELHLKKSIRDKSEEVFPLRTTLELSELMSAVEICLEHPTTIQTEKCPVCETQLDGKKWKSLRDSLQKNDLPLQRQRLEGLERELIRLEEETKSIAKQKSQFQETEVRKKKDLELLRPLLDLKLESLPELEEKLKILEQKSWEQKQILETETRLNGTLLKAREDFSNYRKDHQLKMKNLEQKESELASLKTKLHELIVAPLNEKFLSGLKSDLQLLKELRESERQEEKLLQEKSFLEENLNKLKTEIGELRKELADMKKFIEDLAQTLATELQNEKASEKILSLNQKVKITLEEWRSVEARSKKHDLLAKEATSRLQLLLEQSKDLELQFIKAREDIRSVPAHPVSHRDTLTRLLENLKSFNLDLSSPPELFIPLKELLLSEKEYFKDLVTTLRENLAGLMARLSDWEKRQDKIKLLELKSKDILEKLGRLERLETVLGKDELRTFVLSLVEENLIQQTNEELLKLCQGRYEIIHQSRSRMKLTPEFYVLDKFREGGLRKVATLSGGETFMVSLAMALGLAEMTRGQAEIDSLFIDEGFGTLDQDSLEDVLEMLNQIQTRGLMVGVISHIKGLTDSIPLNLLLSKKQDGTSTLSLQYN